MKTTTQTYQAQVIGILPPHLSMILNGKKKISWELAEKLSTIFPDTSLQWWRYANTEQIKNFLNKNIQIQGE